jgi:uncharacterized protein (DUF2252 family)
MTADLHQRLTAFNADHNPQLVQIKYQKMRDNSFAFLRGTCHLFYDDEAGLAPLNPAPLAWSCGDLHPDNFGSYKGDNRLAYFDVNDFDEAVLAPCTWDPARLATAVLVGAPLVNVAQPQAEALAALFLRTYVERLTQGYVRSIERETATGMVKDLLLGVSTRQRKEFLDAHAPRNGKRRRLKIDGKHFLPITEVERAIVVDAIQAIGPYKGQPKFFQVLDIAHRLAGTGSLGVDRYGVLVEGRGSPNGNFLLDLKEARGSSLAPYVPARQPEWPNEAERVVEVQRRFQSRPPALLTALTRGSTSYMLRELQPLADRIYLAAWDGKIGRLEKLVQTMADVLAWGQLRTSGRQGSATADELIAFACNPIWQNQLMAYAKASATRIEADFEGFAQAFDQGLLLPKHKSGY